MINHRVKHAPRGRTTEHEKLIFEKV
jgi:hypothetical protein